MRPGGEYFTLPAEPTQRRYEALRAYFVDELTDAQVGERFGYSPRVVHPMASELRAGKAEFFASSKPGPKGPRKRARTRDRVLALRARSFARPHRAAQGHPPDQLLLPRAPLLRRTAALRAHPPPPRTGARHRRGGVQPRLPRHPPPRRRHAAREALRPAPLPAHPRCADLLRPRPLLH